MRAGDESAVGATDPPKLPGPGYDLPVDVDGDGASTWGDKYFFNWWLEQGGSLEEAFAQAKLVGDVIDLSGFFATPEAQLAPTSSQESSASGGEGALLQDQLCPQPASDAPNHTRRIPPDIEPNCRTVGDPTCRTLNPSTCEVQDPRGTPDVRFLVFSSNACNLPGAILPPGATQNVYQIYRWEQGASGTGGTLVHVSKKPDGTSADKDCLMPSISGDGNRIVFHTASQLLASDTDSVEDVYLVDLKDPANPRTIRVSAAQRAGARGNSSAAAISGGGGFVAFTSAGTDLGTGWPDQNGAMLDVFRAVITSDGNGIADGVARIDVASINNSGFQSQTTPFSTIGDDPAVCPAIAGQPVGDLRVGRVISQDGLRVVMHGRPCDWLGTNPELCPDPDGNCADCDASCTGDPPETCLAVQQVYLHDFELEEQGQPATFLVSRQVFGGCDGVLAGESCSRRGSISGDGQRIAFSSFARNFRASGLDQDTFEDVFFIDVADVFDFFPSCRQPTRVSVLRCRPQDCTGQPISGGDSFQPILSTNGARIAFASDSERLLGNGLISACQDCNRKRDVFVRDVAAARTILFSVASDGTQGDGNSMNPDLSGDGRVTVYESL
ncbi:MAG: hypothetical protein HY721_20000, partial [Planctomycetes bacterium]|nr:hypothetical protein [Planctomycetota bacterium]